jgi:hypothetical protein
MALPAGAVADVRALYENWQKDPKDSCASLYVAHACLILATADKIRLVDCRLEAHRRRRAAPRHSRRGR